MFTMGVDCGANSTPAQAVRCADGAEFGSCVVGYPSGDQGAPLDRGDHLAGQAPAGLPGDLRLLIDSPNAHAKS